MQKYKIETKVFDYPAADLLTPIGIYMRLRDTFSESLLLESSDSRAGQNGISYICFDPIARFQTINAKSTYMMPGLKTFNVSELAPLDALEEFVSSFELDKLGLWATDPGFFGHICYSAVSYFEDIDLKYAHDYQQIPQISYRFYRWIIAINHHNDQMLILENNYESVLENQTDQSQICTLEKLINLLNNKDLPVYPFELVGSEKSNNTEEEFCEMAEQGRKHCFLGDVFQIVLSRRFSQGFIGDEFNVYRALRMINPSPYLYYFDCGDYKIFGSSPESQLVVKDGKAGIYPIAGTFRRSGDDQTDALLAQQLLEDTKESAEHVMLVDLARNDLSRHGSDVQVDSFKQVQFFSHVIHLVSQVSAKVDQNIAQTLRLMADTFPAGTLSGAPKYKAMQLIDEIEKSPRGYYGGCIGYLGADGAFNHAIMIRSFLCIDNQLIFQAGAGIVSKSEIKSELQEVNNKLAALRMALLQASKMYTHIPKKV